MISLSQITITGTPSEMGYQYGSSLRELIHIFIEKRRMAAKSYLAERGYGEMEMFVEAGRKCLSLLRVWDEPGWIEHCSTAEGARVDAAELYAYANYTDVRDVLTLPALTADAEGCSATLLPAKCTAHGGVIAAQTWDLIPADIDHVVAVHRRPSNGYRTWSITCAGCPSMIGMNEVGVAVGTTNLLTHGSRLGIPYLSLLHRMIRCDSVEEVARRLEGAHRSAAHTYWAADCNGAALWECTPNTAVRRDLENVPIVQTNHCLIPEHQRVEGAPATESSLKRLECLKRLMSQEQQSVESVRRALADRSDGIHSINRFGEDQQGTSTNACVIAIPSQREIHACRGPADRGHWVRLYFDESKLFR